MQPAQTHKVTGRWFADFDPQIDRLKYGDRILNIDSAINVGERNREWELLCAEEATPPERS